MAAEMTVTDVSLAFGGINVLEDVTFSVPAGSILGLVGPNGAGKTSLFNCISGHYKPNRGSVTMDGEELLGQSAWRLNKRGLARTFQHPALQLHSTVVENVLLGANSRLPGGPVEWGLRLPHVVRREQEATARARELLARFGIGQYADERADEIPHGLHKTVELCRALMSGPSLLLLDEPAAGLVHSEIEMFIENIRRMHAEFDLTIVIVEHHMGLIAALTNRVVVLDHGRKLMEGTAAEAQNDPRVIEAYLGTKGAA